jgi:tRNA(fMet)-specific endonuclease VapC
LSSPEAVSAEYEHLLRRVHEHGPSDFFVSIITFHEQVMGWNAYISRARDSAGVVRGYERLQRVLSNFCEAQVLPFNEAAASIFNEMRRRKVRVGSMDLRIASIALSQDITVLSRNLSDFGRVTGLRVEDWTLP